MGLQTASAKEHFAETGPVRAHVSFTFPKPRDKFHGNQSPDETNTLQISEL